MAKRQGSGVVLGYLKYVLGFDSLAFDKGLGDAEKRLKKAQRELGKISDGFKSVGEAATKFVTVPIVAAGAGFIKMAGDFESAMNEVSISTQATAGEMKALKDLALDIGKSTTKSASESAAAMDMLAKAGLNASQILGGAARATVALAEAAGSELEPAAAAVTDSMTQFKLTTSDLPRVINQITGAVNESKMAFADFQGASSQAGGVAASLGVSFEDFNAVLAGTSANFASGSDAGTSFKTFLTTLTGKSSTALGAMQKLGLSFYDAQGNMKGMAEIAQMLRDKLGGLSEEARTEALRDIFGTDAMRTAIGLMDLGAEGLDKIKAKIGETNAAAQAAQRMKGFNAEMEKLGGSIETLAIKVADAGLIEVVTKLVTKISEFVDWMSSANPELLKWGTIVAAVAAAVGPLAFAMGGLVSAFSAMLPLLGGAGLTAALGTLGPVLVPLVATVAALAAAWALFGDKIGPVLSELGAKAQEVLGPRLTEMINVVSATLTELWNGPIGGGIRLAIQHFGTFQAAYTRVFGSLLIGTISAAIDVLSAAFTTIGGLLTTVSRLLRGDFAGAWEAVKTTAVKAVMALMSAINTLTGGALTSFGRLVQGIRDWMINKLNAIWDTVKAKVESVKGWFYGLYDAVVGHSYIPDMVEGIKAQMDRLDAVMVAPAKAAAGKAAQAFRDMAGEVKALLDRLFPEAAKLRQLEHELSLIDNSGLTKEQKGEARFRLMEESIRNNKADDSWKLAESEIEDNGEALDRWMKGAADEAAKMSASLDKSLGKGALAFANLAQTAIGSLRGLVDAIKGGDWLDILTSVVDAIAQVLSGLNAGAGAGAGGGAGGMGGLGAALGSIFGGGGFAGMRAGGGAVMPGRTYWVGENGPEPFTPNRSGFVTPSRAMGGERGRKLYFDLRGAVMTQDLLAQMNAMAAGAENNAVSRVERRTVREQQRGLGRP